MRDTTEEYSSEYQNMAFHPFNVILMLSLIGLGGLFLTLSIAFVYNRVQSNLPPHGCTAPQ